MSRSSSEGCAENGNFDGEYDVEKMLMDLRGDVIGGSESMEGPWGPVPLVYADYTASGRLLQSIEDFMQKVVYPVYANTHTEASYCGAMTSQLYKQARNIICECLQVNPKDFAVLFTGSGSTGAIDRLAKILNLTKKKKYYQERPVIFVGPYEHHSNEVMWREVKCDVVVIPEDQDGAPDLDVLQKKLHKYKTRAMKIGSFSAGSNVTGIISDVDKIAQILHDNGALAFFDFAGSGAYVPINANNKDAIFLSPHKFIGGPGSSGVLVFRRSIYKSKVPSVPAGGTVSYVTPKKHWFIEDIEAREEGGTPPILQAIRAALALRFKHLVGEHLIEHLEEKKIDKFLGTLSRENLNLFLIGSDRPIYWKHPRVSIFSFLIPYHDPNHPQQKALHHNFVAALLNDLYGIQSRSGCFCAGPYGHRLFDSLFGNVEAISQKIQPLVVEGGFEALKWGWVRINLNYFISDEEVDYIIQAIIQIAKHGWKLIPQYSVDIHSGLWKHRMPGQTKTNENVPSLFNFGTKSLEQKKCERPSFEDALSNAKFLYDNAQHVTQQVYHDERFQSTEVDPVRWFPIPQEIVYLLKDRKIILQEFNSSFAFNNFKKETFKEKPKVCKTKMSFFRFKSAGLFYNK